MRLGSQIRQHSQQPKSRLEILLNEEQREHPQGYSPYVSRSNFDRRDRSTPFHFSGPQIPQNKAVNMHNERYHNLSVLTDPRKIESRGNPNLKNEQDNNISYLKQIEGLTNKRKARYYFKRNNEGYQDNFKIGVLTPTGIEEWQDKLNKSNQLTQPAPFSLSKQESQNISMQETHYQMVRTQQRYKNILKE